jgi:hypothetical protein
VFHLLECFPVTLCDPATFRLEALEQGVKATFCQQRASVPSEEAATESAAQEAKSLPSGVERFPDLPSSTDSSSSSSSFDETSSETQEEQPRQRYPLGLKVLLHLQNRLDLLVAMAEAYLVELEQQQVATFLQNVVQTLKTLKESCIECGQSVYEERFPQWQQLDLPVEDQISSLQTLSLGESLRSSWEENLKQVLSAWASDVGLTPSTNPSNSPLAVVSPSLSSPSTGETSVSRVAPATREPLLPSVPASERVEEPAPQKYPSSSSSSSVEEELSRQVEELSERYFRLTGQRI